MSNISFPVATIDRKSNVIHQNNEFKNLFRCDISLYSSPILSPYKEFFSNQDKDVIETGIVTKTLLVNACEHNLILKKYPVILYDQIVCIQVIPEIFRLHTLKNVIQYTHSNLDAIATKYFDINNYSKLQQEIIFCMLRGYHTDKGIANKIHAISQREISAKSIERAIGKMYAKLFVSDRESLVCLFHHLNFDKYIPETLYQAGVYNIESDISNNTFTKILN